MLPALMFCLSLAGAEPRQAGFSRDGREFTYLFSQGPSGPAPLLVVAGGDDLQGTFRKWEQQAAGRGWRLMVPASNTLVSSTAVLESAFTDLNGRAPVDTSRIYLAGEGNAAAAVFYAAARMPHLWAAVLAAGSNVKGAIDSNGLFAANSQLVPLLWLVPENQPAAAKLAAAGFRFERGDPSMPPGAALDRLAANRREPAPPKVDCETGSPAFARCYWLEITRFDPTRRNDVLATSRVSPGSGASLALGGFGYDASAPGPGVLVGWLPEKYNGPLRLNDRIIAIRGKPVADGSAYAALMDGQVEEGPATVMVERGREKLRIETRIVLPKRPELLTARVQAEFSIENREALIVSRNVSELKLDAPAPWVPFALNWNGRDLGSIAAPGCWVLSDAGARRCDPGAAAPPGVE